MLNTNLGIGPVLLLSTFLTWTLFASLHIWGKRNIKLQHSNRSPIPSPEAKTEYPDHITKNMENGMSQNPEIVNRTLPGKNSHTVYNRIEKCGSSSFMGLINYISKQNGFKFVFQWSNGKVSGSVLKYNLNTQKQFCRRILSTIRPFSVYAEHLRFIDCSKILNLKDQKFNWINLVRHPIARFHSWFQFVRKKSGPKSMKRLSDQMKTRFGRTGRYISESRHVWLNKSFNECVLTRDPECVIRVPTLLVKYFSGHTDLEFREAIAMAKFNVEKHYSVIGVLEEMPKSLKVFEAYFPILFKGISKKLLPLKNASKQTSISEEAFQMLTSMFAPEIEFYNYLKQRLSQQHSRLMKA